MNKMKTLTLQGVTFEVVDEQARASIPEKIVQAVNGVEPDENGNVTIEISGGGVSPEEVTTIVKEQFPGGVGYSEIKEVELYRNEDASGLRYTYNHSNEALFFQSLVIGQRYIGVFDGVRYEGFAKEHPDSGLPYVDFSGDDSICLLGDPTAGVILRYEGTKPTNTIVIIAIEERISTISPKFLPEGHQFGGTPEKYFQWGGAYTDTGDNFIYSITATSPDTGETMEAPVVYAKLTDEIVSRKQLVGDSTTSGAMRANGTTYPVVIEDSFVYSSETHQMVMPTDGTPLLFSGSKGVAVFSVTLDGMEMQLSCNLPSDGTYVFAMDGQEVYALRTAEDITPISAKYMPKVADLSGTWIADLKAALGI